MASEGGGIAPRPCWELFEDLRGQAYLYIDLALKLEEELTTGPVDPAEFRHQAAVMYRKGLRCLDEALALPATLPGTDSVTTMAKLAKDRAGMSRARQGLVLRLRELEAGEPVDGGRLETPAAAVAIGEDIPLDADVLFFVAGDVRVFYVGASGQTSPLTSSSSLHVYKLPDGGAAVESRGSLPDPTFIQVGTWTYPLAPGSKTVVIQSTSNSFMFLDADALSANPAGNAAVCLVLPEEMPEPDGERFRTLLAGLVEAPSSSLGEDDLMYYDEYLEYSSKVAQTMVRGAGAIGQGLVDASLFGGELLRKGSSKFKGSIVQAPDGQFGAIHPNLKKGLEVAGWVTEKGVGASSYLVSVAGTTSAAIGRFLAPHVRQAGARALSHVAEQSQEKSERQLAVVSELASGGVQALSTIYCALEDSGKILAKNVAESTVDVVTHRYGSDVGDFAGGVMTTVGNAYMVSHNAGALGVKGLAKRVAKETGKAAVHHASGSDQKRISDDRDEAALR